MPNRIFVIEEDLAIRFPCERVLNAAGYETAGFGSYFAAAAEIDKGAGALLVVDIKLPQGTPQGLSVARMARHHRPGLPVIFITSDLETAKLAGGEVGPVMLMPLNLEDLVATVHDLLSDPPPAQA